MKYESVYSNGLIPRHTNVVDEVLLIADRTQCRKEPTVPIEALPDITCCRIIFVKRRLLKDIRQTLDRSRPMPIIIASRLQTVQTVSSVSFQIKFNVKMGVPILGIDPAAFLRYFDHCIFAFGDGLFIRFASVLAPYKAFGGMLRLALRVDICREDTGHFARILGSKLKSVSDHRSERSPRCLVRTLCQNWFTSVWGDCFLALDVGCEATEGGAACALSRT